MPPTRPRRQGDATTGGWGSEEKRENLLRRGWRKVRDAGLRRLTISGMLVAASIALGYFSWSLPVMGSAERALYDARLYFEADREPIASDPRVVMVVLDDETLIAARKRSPFDQGLLVQVLRNLDSLGPKAMGIDMLFDQPQDDDATLIATLHAMKTPVSVGYADVATNAGEISYSQQAFLDGLLRARGCGPERRNRR